MRNVPWHVLRMGRPVEHDEHGFYFTAPNGERFYEYPDDDVDPDAVARWDEALDRKRRDRARQLRNMKGGRYAR